MWKEKKKTVILTSIITLLPIVAGLIFWNQLPEQMATHFNLNNEPDGWSSKAFAVFGLPLIVLAAHLLCVFGTSKDPRYDRYPEKMKNIVLWICPICCWICAIGTYGYALNGKMMITEWVFAFLGLMFVIVGNYLPKIKQNLYLGIKLPWTYATEENWNKTHRFGGKVWVIGGCVMLLNIFMKIRYLEVVLMIALVLIPTVYSYLYSKKERKEA